MILELENPSLHSLSQQYEDAVLMGGPKDGYKIWMRLSVDRLVEAHGHRFAEYNRVGSRFVFSGYVDGSDPDIQAVVNATPMWRCQNDQCGTIYAEYVNGCPRCGASVRL